MSCDTNARRWILIEEMEGFDEMEYDLHIDEMMLEDSRISELYFFYTKFELRYEMKLKFPGTLLFVL